MLLSGVAPLKDYWEIIHTANLRHNHDVIILLQVMVRQLTVQRFLLMLVPVTFFISQLIVQLCLTFLVQLRHMIVLLLVISTCMYTCHINFNAYAYCVHIWYYHKVISDCVCFLSLNKRLLNQKLIPSKARCHSTLAQNSTHIKLINDQFSTRDWSGLVLIIIVET